MRPWLRLFCAGLVCAAVSVGAEEETDYARLLWSHLESQVAFGPRNPGSAGHLNARQYIKTVGSQLGLEVRELAFRAPVPGGPLPLYNVEFRIPGTEGGRPVLLGAHYDTRPFSDEDPDPNNRPLPIVGANDGGSGTAVLLGLARYFKEHPARRPVHLVFFDGEDYGPKFSSEYFLGSKEYARNLRGLSPEERPMAVLVVDMVGDSDLKMYKEVYSHEAAPWLLDLVFQTAGKLGYPQFVPRPRHTIRDDHLPFIEVGVPAVVLIDFDYPHWHTQQDTLDKCSPESLLVVFSVVRRVVAGM